METISDLIHRHPTFNPAKGVYDDMPTDAEVFAANTADFFELVQLGMLTDTVVGGVITRTKEEKWAAICEKYGNSGPLSPEDEARMIEVNYQRMSGRMAKAGVPASYIGVPSDARFDNIIGQGLGLYVYGEVSVGKTTLACSVLKAWLTANMYGEPLFVTAPELMSRLSSTYNTGVTQEEAISAFIDCPLLVIDDVGKEPDNQNSSSRMWRIINDRCANSKPTIITSQLAPNEYLSRFSSEDASSLSARLSRGYRLLHME